MEVDAIRARPRLAPSDVALAGIPLLLVVVNAAIGINPPRPSALTTVVGGIGCLALLGRRTWPVQVLLTLGVTSLIPTLGFGHEPDLYASYVPSMIAIYAVAAYRPVRYVLLIAAFSVVVLTGFAIRGPVSRQPSLIVFNVLSIVLVTVGGRVVQHLNTRVRTFADRASLLEREQDLLAREAVVAERERIARELHDVIAHDVSLMVIQAGAARRAMQSRPAAADEALSLIQDNGRRTVEELHLLLGMLRAEGQDLAPQRGLSAVEDLVKEVGRSGLPVELRITGERRDLGSVIELSAYRLVQEALTNVMKHAAGSQAVVELGYEPARLTVQVTDDGSGPDNALLPATALRASGGHGLLGMRERVRMFGGSFHAGRRPDGGWLIAATLPLASEAS